VRGKELMRGEKKKEKEKEGMGGRRGREGRREAGEEWVRSVRRKGREK
jgi:hypothetical protein